MRSQESEEFGQTGSVGMIFNDTQFDAKDFVRLRTLGGSREQKNTYLVEYSFQKILT